MPIYLCATRFNSETWNENNRFKNSKNIKGCIYGSPKKISNTITNDSYIIVIEMLNKPLPKKISERSLPGSGGSIMGIGLIRNCLFHKQLRIYQVDNYNRYLYKSKYRIDRADMNETEETAMNILDNICFKGADHIKRGKGISMVPINKIKNIEVREINITTFLMNMFTERYQEINPLS